MATDVDAFSALFKEFYTEGVPDLISSKVALHDLFEEVEATVIENTASISYKIGRNQSPMASAQNAILPSAGNSRHVRGTVPLRKTTGRCAFTVEVINASRSNRSSFKRAISSEMDDLVNSMARARNEYLCGYGTGVVARVDGDHSASATTLTLTAPGGFTGTTNPNRFVQTDQTLAVIRNGALVANTPLTVTGITESGSFNQVTVAANSATLLDGDYLVRAASPSVTALTDTDWQIALMGLFGLVDDGTYVRVLHGVDRQTYPIFRAYVGSMGAFSADAVQMALDAVSIKSGKTISQLWCEHGVRRAYLVATEDGRRYSGAALSNPQLGTKAATQSEIDFAPGVAFKVERDFPYGMIVGLPGESVLERYVSVRGKWEETQGNVLVPNWTGGAGGTHAWGALYYMQDNFGINAPNATMRLGGISTAQIAVHID